MFEFDQWPSIQYSQIYEIIRWFSSLKHLTFVAEDHAGIPRDTDLVVTDLVSFDTLLRFFEAGSTREKDLDLEQYEVKFARTASLRLELEKHCLGMQRNEGIRNGLENVGWEMPEIDRKVITTVERKATYDKAV